MAFVQTAILIFTYFSFFIGQIIRLNLFGNSFPLIDIAISLLSVMNLYQHFKNKEIKPKNLFFLLFLGYSWFFLFINQVRYQTFSIIPILYLLRLTFLLSFLIYPIKIKTKIKNIFILFLVANILFGFIQYFFWPDFTYFNIANWDPHLYRLLSTYFDPTFTALIYLFFIIKLFLDTKTPYRWFLIIISYLAMSLTYSRSTYLSFIISFLFISVYQKELRVFVLSLIVVVLTIFSLPRQPGEGTKLERTSSVYAKIENYQQGFNLFLKSPIIGIGYNNIYLFKNEQTNSHSQSGFDSSLLTVLVTTGIVGLIIFLTAFSYYFKNTNLLKKTIIIAIFIHSLFANSLFYPWILLSLVLF